MNHFDQTQLAVCPTACPRRTLTHATYRRIAVSVAALHSSRKTARAQLLHRRHKTSPPNSTRLHSAAPRDVRLPCRHL